MLRTAEEILNKHMGIFWASDWEQNEYSDKKREEVEIIAINEARKETAIDFLKWFWFESKYELSNEGIYKDMGDDESYQYITWDSLYELFLKSLIKELK